MRLLESVGSRYRRELCRMMRGVPFGTDFRLSAISGWAAHRVRCPALSRSLCRSSRRCRSRWDARRDLAFVSMADNLRLRDPRNQIQQVLVAAPNSQNYPGSMYFTQPQA